MRARSSSSRCPCGRGFDSFRNPTSPASLSLSSDGLLYVEFMYLRSKTSPWPKECARWSQYIEPMRSSRLLGNRCAAADAA